MKRIKVQRIEETRLICAKCGSCAGHFEDRINGCCHFCGAVKTISQKRNIKGEWINTDEPRTQIPKYHDNPPFAIVDGI